MKTTSLDVQLKLNKQSTLTQRYARNQKDESYRT